MGREIKAIDFPSDYFPFDLFIHLQNNTVRHSEGAWNTNKTVISYKEPIENKIWIMIFKLVYKYEKWARFL